MCNACAGPTALSCQLLQQDLGLLQVCCVKALGKPPINRREHLVGFGSLALLLPQPTQAHPRPQLQRLRLLAAGDFEGLLKTGFRLCCMGHVECGMMPEDTGLRTLASRLEYQLAPEPMQF